ncbi:hypothetical protein DCAR_0520203 [Daucus carota subsp. sativus]|uniref:Uncharacterized protein n=1 Tax=Daucus carota subsp. sativus TaxID=79200 RepID=A0A161YLG5_DAUCS|nr:PREDICTED: bZIP transcription factor 60-like [Daucus carota subsp. sativus]WOH00828.1 hypothetical protein DCAR_0520203 [Daucus carota subsp. sativus]
MSDLITGDDEFNLDQLLNDPDFLNDVNLFDELPGQISGPDPYPNEKFAEIEQLLMNDDFDQSKGDELLFDVLLDSPVESEASRGEVLDDSKTSSPETVVQNGDKDANDGEEDDKNFNEESGDGEKDDPVSKKRKRQERNRDAAVKSRERKKLYVKDLEMKSRYFEGECRRLGMLLNCVIAENQALRLSLHSSKAFDASMTKQESAVLLLESLLLGSLLWFLGNMCLLILPDSLQSTKEEVPLENVDNGNQGSLALVKAGRVEHGLHQNMLGKRCKASRSRMRPSYLVPEVIA